MITVEVGEPSTRRPMFQQQQNEENTKVELETTEEVQDMVRIREEATKLQAARRYNTKVQPWAFQPGDLVWRVRGEARKGPWARKLGPNWEGPFKVPASQDNEAYKLHELDGKEIPRQWSIQTPPTWSSTSVDLMQTQMLYFFSFSSLLSKKRKIRVLAWKVLTRHI